VKNKHETIALALQVAQLLVIAFGISALAVNIGRKDASLTHATEDIRALQTISSDLVRATIESTSSINYHRERIENLRERVTALESWSREVEN
jgi:hypothetical protein|tara:strand:- start:106 stop:384 length:279 start_codon:yes stop_codon:yes gene_type:complete